MILTNLSLRVTYEDLLKLLQVRSGYGTPASNIRHLETLNLEVNYRTLGTFEDLYDNLSQGQPCIAFIKTGELSYWTENINHAVVVVGLNDQYIYFNDPAFPTAPVQLERREFDLAWLEWNETYVVVTPRT
jgi:ABC-type bacteriocin/lantibiotic exporter with double-glycine peptidase domain